MRKDHLKIKILFGKKQLGTTDKYSLSKLEMVTTEQLRQLSQFDNTRAFFYLIREWSIILTTLVLCDVYFSWPFYLLAVVVVGARQHALGIILHDASHYRLNQNRRLNDRLANWLAAWPLLITLEGYRKEHFLHHRFTGTDLDPDQLSFRSFESYQLPMSRTRFVLTSMGHLVGLFSFRIYYIMCLLTRMSLTSGLRYNFERLLYYTFVFIFLGLTGHISTYLMFWLVPSLTVLPFLLYFRLVAEHFGLNKSELHATRNVHPSLWERFFVSPLNVGLHIDHHLYPSVPHYKLKKLNKLLMKNKYYAENSIQKQGYFKELILDLIEHKPSERLTIYEREALAKFTEPIKVS